MKKYIIFIVPLLIMFSVQGWSYTIDEISITIEEPFIIGIKSSYPDGCDRNALLQPMTMENQVEISFFTQ